MLWAALHFPALPVEIFTRGCPTAEPFVVTDGGNRPGIVGANETAIAAGVRQGMMLSAAYPLVPALRVRMRDTAAEGQALASLALWCEQFTPTISVAATTGLLLEIGGSLRYFGGLAPLLDRLRSGLGDLGYRVAAGIAPTPAGAQLLARAGLARPAPDIPTLQAALARLPLALLDCSTATIDALAATGVHSLGDALRLPRDGLARRFGQALIDEIDRALGRLPDPRPLFIAPPRYRGQLELPAPVVEVDALAFALKRLVNELAGWLLGRGLGVMRMRLDLAHDRQRGTRRVTPMEIRLSAPSRTPEHLLSVWRERLSRLILADPLVDRIEGLALRTEETTPLAANNLGLLPGDGTDAGSGSPLADRLRARLGEDAIVAVMPHPDHRPEFAWRSAAIDAHPRCTTGSATAPPPPRPVWLLREPEPLGRLLADDKPWVLMDGPERIESGWWEGRDVRRDYFVARSPRGETCWIYRDPRYDDEWFLHGIFG